MVDPFGNLYQRCS